LSFVGFSVCVFVRFCEFYVCTFRVCFLLYVGLYLFALRKKSIASGDITNFFLEIASQLESCRIGSVKIRASLLANCRAFVLYCH
jgi:hypothetical protein